jgi:hypothetical protein
MKTRTEQLNELKWSYDHLVLQHEERKSDGDATERQYEDMNYEEEYIELKMEELSLAILQENRT